MDLLINPLFRQTKTEQPKAEPKVVIQEAPKAPTTTASAKKIVKPKAKVPVVKKIEGKESKNQPKASAGKGFFNSFKIEKNDAKTASVSIGYKTLEDRAKSQVYDIISKGNEKNIAFDLGNYDVYQRKVAVNANLSGKTSQQDTKYLGAKIGDLTRKVLEGYAYGKAKFVNSKGLSVVPRLGIKFIDINGKETYDKIKAEREISGIGVGAGVSAIKGKLAISANVSEINEDSNTEIENLKNLSVNAGYDLGKGFEIGYTYRNLSGDATSIGIQQLCSEGLYGIQNRTGLRYERYKAGITSYSGKEKGNGCDLTCRLGKSFVLSADYKDTKYTNNQIRKDYSNKQFGFNIRANLK